MCAAGYNDETIHRERAKAARARAQLHALAAIRFRGAAFAAQSITDPAWLLSGPAETGKTFSGLYRLDTEVRRWPKSQWVLARKIRATMDSTVLNTWRRIIAIRGGVIVFGGEKPGFYIYPNGARVWIMGFDNAQNILSGEFDGAYINQCEDLAEHDYETLTTRVTGRGAKTNTPMVFGDCNPGAEDHWIIRRRDAGTMTLLESKHVDNPTLYTENGQLTEQGKRSMAALQRLTGVRYQRLYLGLWVGAEGAYFGQLDDRIHVLPETKKPPAYWTVWGALDYGFQHPLSFGVLGKDPNDTLYLLGHHTANKWLIAQHVQEMDGILAHLGIDKRTFVMYAGHDCWVEGKDDPETIADKFAKHGYHLKPATIARKPGASALTERLGNFECDPPVRETLYFNPSCKRVFASLARMVHNPRDPEDVLKVDADASGRGGDDDYDMLRYGVMAARTHVVIHQPKPVQNRWKGM